MDNFNNKIQLLMQEQDELKKDNNQNKKKKKKSRNINSSGGTSCCVNNSTSTGSSGSGSGSKGRGRGRGRGGVMKLSTEPQSVAARQRRHRISDKFKMLKSLIPGGTSNKMDTVSMLEEAIHYIKFLKTQLCLHHTIMMNSINDQHVPVSSSSDHDDDLFLNSIINFNSSLTTNGHVNNMVNNLSLYSPPPPPAVQYPPQSPHQFLSSSSSTSGSTTYNIPPPASTAAAGISGMPPLHHQQ